jgi:SET domain-containing protein
LFRFGSKLAHTCGSPNTQYKTYSGKGYHIALRDIAAGELLTTTYLDKRVNLMTTRMR